MPAEYVSTVLEDAAGFVWIGSTSGELHRLELARLSRLPSPPLRIARLEADGVPHSPGTDPVRVRAGSGRLVIGVGPKSYRQLGRLRFEYR